MMSRKFSSILFLLTLTGLMFTGCKKWEDHNAISNPALDKTLLQQIKDHKDLGRFSALIVKAGYEDVLASSKSFTVFAPTDAALASLDPAIEGDVPKLRLFIGNHIADQTYASSAAVADTLRILMLSGKYNNMKGSKVEAANLVTVDQLAKNGLVHVIDQPLPALKNSWEVIETDATIPAKQKTYLLNLFRNVFDATNAVQIGVNETTGRPIYQPGTDSIRTNLFWRNVYDLRNETNEYTLFVLTDDLYDAEVSRFKPYFLANTEDSTLDFTRWDVVKDLAVMGKYEANELPDTLLSRFGVKLPINRAAVVRTIKTSNGRIHIMSALPIAPVDKLPVFTIQAENYRYTSHEKRGNTYFRDRFNPLTTSDFRDILVLGHGTSLFNINYQIRNVNSTKYRAYWVAVNDFQTANFTQKLGIGIATSTVLPYTTVTPNNFSEVLLGEFTMDKFSPVLDVFLTAANSTTQAANSIVCDYIKLVPVF